MRKKKVIMSREEKKRLASADTRPRTTCSWYKYVKIKNPSAFKEYVYENLNNIDCFGRIYIAEEGINAQMNVPTIYFDRFDAWVQSQLELRGVPYKIAVEEHDLPSFYKLTVKVRDKIVADGLDDNSFDVTDKGDYLTPREMNDYICNPDALVIDMRNNYESEIGYFEGAVRPNVATFRDELQYIPKKLSIHKNKKIALYCTGGIRCEKASAWLKHNGFKDVRHLKGGIIDYAQAVKCGEVENKFKGKNFVFDERLCERISSDIVSTCHLCKKTKCDSHHHCRNQICHALFIGCNGCVSTRNGYCSSWCSFTDKAPRPLKKFFARYYNAWQRRKPFKKIRV